MPARLRIGRHVVRQKLEEAILAGHHRPGEKLVQQKIAGQHNVAQAVVREALVELEARGLVESIDNRGVFVAEITVENLIESLQIRERLEGMAAALCCRRTTRGQLEELADVARQIAQLAQDGRFKEASVAENQFHHCLLELSGNKMLLRMADQYRVVGKRAVLGAGVEPKRRRAWARPPKEVLEQHLSILKAIEEGREDEAEQRMRAHIRAGRQELEKYVAEGHVSLSSLP